LGFVTALSGQHIPFSSRVVHRITFTITLGNQMKSLRLALGAACVVLVGSAQANLTGVTVNPTPVTVGQKVAIVVSATGNMCAGKFVLNGNNHYVTANTKEVGGQITNAPGTPGKTELFTSMLKPGTYPITITGATGGAIAPCVGTLNATIVVQAPPTAVGLPGTILTNPIAPLHCPGGYDKVSENTDKGEIRCSKQAATCPTGYEGGMNTATGQLECRPRAAGCPEGWNGGLDNGVLKCAPKTQPNLACPKQAPQAQHGTSYYREGWRVMGCVANLAPPR
jgi:hypothetical protein